MFDHAFCSHELPLSPSENVRNYPPSLSVREVTTAKANMPAMMGTCLSLFPNVSSFAFKIFQCTEICEISEAGHLYVKSTKFGWTY